MRRDTMKELFELMVFGPPPMDNVRGRQAKTEESQAKIDYQRPLAHGECTNREAQGTSHAGDNAETER